MLFEKTNPSWETPLQTSRASLEDALVDLTGASCRTLEDADGVAWGAEVSLKLENFTYTRITSAWEDSKDVVPWPWNRCFSVAGIVWINCGRVASLFRRIRYSPRGLFRLPPLPLLQPQDGIHRDVPLWFSNLQKSRLRSTGARRRLRWLEQRRAREERSQDRSHPEPFLPQPYTQLARVLRDQGVEAEARQVDAQRIHIERWHLARQSLGGLIALPFFGLYRIFFLYGLSPFRALSTFAICLALGWAGTAFVNRSNGLLVQSTSTVATAISMSGDTTTPIVPYEPKSGKASVDCGTTISEPLYAIDVFIPLLDLRQETRCDIRSVTARDLSPRAAYLSAKGSTLALLRGSNRAVRALLVYPPLWQLLKSMYAILGWIVTSLTILTFSGTLRKWDQSK